jgi:hypothetical protein
LYSIAEAGTYWWATYFKHHREKLYITMLTYNPCLLITTVKERFAIVRIQTDDTLGLLDSRFITLEQDKLNKAGFIAKSKETLTITE